MLELGVGEQSNLQPHPSPKLAPDANGVPHEENVRAEVGMAVDVDLVHTRVAGARQRSVNRDLAAGHPALPLALVLPVGAEPRQQHDVRVAGFRQDSGRHTATVIEIPGRVEDVGLAQDDARALRAGDVRVQSGHPIGEQQGRPRRPELVTMTVLAREALAEDRRDPAGGQRLELPASQDDAGGTFVLRL